MVLTAIFWAFVGTFFIGFASFNVVIISWTINKVRKIFFGNSHNKETEE